MAFERQDLDFQDNWNDMRIGPAQPAVELPTAPSMQESFARASQPMPQDMRNDLNAPAPDQPAFQPYQAEAAGDFLRHSGFQSDKLGDVGYLGASVANVTMELFGSLEEKGPQMDGPQQPFGPGVPQYELNAFAPKGPAMFGL